MAFSEAGGAPQNRVEAKAASAASSSHGATEYLEPYRRAYDGARHRARQPSRLVGDDKRRATASRVSRTW